MIKSVNAFKDKIESVSLPGSSIGVYSLEDNNKSDIIANQITDMFYNGISNRRKEHIINDINIYGTTEDWGYREILYSVLPEVIVAIPEVLTTYNGHTYYLGNFSFLDVRKHKFHERDNGNITKLWFYDYMKHAPFFPCEFILGASVYDNKKKTASFILNPNYIGLQDDEEQTKIASDIFKRYTNSLKNAYVKKLDWDNLENDYNQTCNGIESTIDKAKAFYLSQYKEYLEKKYHFLYRKKQ